MKIFITCSTSFYDRVENIKNELEYLGFEVVLPNCYNEDTPELNTDDDYNVFFREMFNQSKNKIDMIDAILVLNFDKTKNGVVYKDYIGPSTFLEMYEGFMKNKKIYMFNRYNEGIFYDEVRSFKPIVIDGNLKNIK